MSSIWRIFLSVFLGELYRRRDPWYHGQEAQYPKHVCYCSRRPRQIYPDRFPFVQSWYYCWSKSWWNQSYRHQKRRAGEMYYHQIHVSFRKEPKSESIKLNLVKLMFTSFTRFIKLVLLLKPKQVEPEKPSWRDEILKVKTHTVFP